MDESLLLPVSYPTSAAWAHATSGSTRTSAPLDLNPWFSSCCCLFRGWQTLAPQPTCPGPPGWPSQAWPPPGPPCVPVSVHNNFAVILDHLICRSVGWGSRAAAAPAALECCLLSPRKPPRKPWAGLRKGRGQSPARQRRRSPGIREF